MQARKNGLSIEEAQKLVEGANSLKDAKELMCSLTGPQLELNEQLVANMTEPWEARWGWVKPTIFGRTHIYFAYFCLFF